MKKFIFLSLFLSHMIAAQDHLSQKVAVFKDGTGFYDKRLRLQADNKTFVLDQYPQALFGTLWLYSLENPILGVRSFLHQKTEQQPFSNIADLLQANQGKKAILQLENQKIEGVIEQVHSELVIVRSNGEWTAWKVKDVKNVHFLEKPKLTLDTQKSQKVLAIDFKNSAKTADLGLIYMQKGISWLPNYLIELKDNNKAKIQLKASLLNDAEDLIDAQVSFVVGVPNFKYKNLDEPLISTESIETFLAKLNNKNPMPQMQMQRNMVSQSFANIAEYDFAVGENEGSEQEDTQNSEDLFFYEKKGINLPKGGRAFFTIFEAELDFEHIFEAELSPNNAYNTYVAASSNEKQVWHSIQFQNKTAFPWTTGTAMVGQNKETIKPLSQDMLRYTPKSAKTDLKLTVAPDILVKDNEIETERKTSAKKLKKSVYDLVSVEGNVEIKNFKDKDLVLLVKRKVTGMLKSSNEKWEYEKKVNYDNSPNEINEVVWKISLKAGESKTLEYKYQVYLPQ